MRGPLSGVSELFNYVEIGLWGVLGLIVGGYALRRTGPTRRHAFVAALTLIAFGVSDWFEIQTGGEWWRPWWLLAWKAACVGTLLVLLILARKRQQAARKKGLTNDETRMTNV